MGKLFSAIVRFFVAKPVFFLLLLLGILSTLVVGLTRLNIDEDLYSVFPKSEQYQRFNSIIQENSLNKQIVFSIDANQDANQLEENLSSIENKIDDLFNARIKDVQIYRNVNEKKLVGYLQKSFVLSASDQDYAEIENKITPNAIDAALKRDADKLEGTNGFFLKGIVALDPLGLTSKQLEKAKPEEGKGSYLVKDGLVYTQDEKSILFFATLALDSKDMVALANLNEDLTKFKTQINSELPIHFDYFGTFQIAVENAQQVKADTYLTSFLSIALIVLLLIVYYRSFFAPVFFILPAVFGVLCGMGMVGWLQPSISAISLATASVLLGIVLDYSFHFFTHYKHSGDIRKTIEEISAPMVIGSFTTVAALGALLFADSVILQNFGLIALFTLLGSVLFTLLIQPTLFILLRVKLPFSENTSGTKKVPKILLRLGILAVVAFTAISLLRGFDAFFDADINNLSFHSEELKRKEAFYTGIQPEKDKKFYVIATSSSLEEAKKINAAIYDSLSHYRKELKISELISTAPYLPSQQRIKEQTQKWQDFWLTRKEKVLAQISQSSPSNNFSPTAFTPFSDWISANDFDTAVGEELMTEIGLSKFAYTANGNQSYITSIVIGRSELMACKKALHQIDGAFILDLSEITEVMLNSVQNDFNFLLIFSALLVFITLIIIYGRIELALFAFFPMLLAWIWILGITSIFDIKFNFVNIIIATFIFGLGDDFSIFTTDGLIQQYKTGSDSYKSYRSAILLSGLTTLVGTGVLIFAKHPAIHSIALISIVGISTILLITLFVQPYLFRLFVLNRTEKKKAPITFFTWVYSLFLFAYFFIGSLFLTILVVFILFPLPIKKTKKRAFLNFLISKLAKSTIYAGFQVKKEVYIDKIDFDEPKIIVANHSSFLDILLVLMIHPKTVIMVKSWVYNSPVFGLFIRYAGFPFAKEGASDNLEQIKARLSEGYSIVIFPEGTRSINGEMNRFHKGAFHIAEELKIAIQPLLLIGVHEVNPKNDILINRGKIIVQAMDSVPYNPEMNYSAASKAIKAKMLSGMLEAKKEHAGTDFWGPILQKNYVLKGPILEWYVRIKWFLEKKNFAQYDALIGNRKVIYDFGCGYGYLSYFLHYRDKSRLITSVDYDQEKIAVAQAIPLKSENLTFVAGDIREIPIEKCDVIFLNDVLHYLPKSDQDIFLQKSIDQLNANGILLLRDGLQDNEKSHKMTKFTEFLSTKVFGFNKSENPMEFISIVDIREFAEKNNLELEITKHSNTTSNVLFTLQKRKLND
ncbi:MAG: 1-acyl-sn-glycerol-3-phosphate acyltransferase [Crocinitomicaceae bacterium]